MADPECHSGIRIHQARIQNFEKERFTAKRKQYFWRRVGGSRPENQCQSMLTMACRILKAQPTSLLVRIVVVVKYTFRYQE
jgi:hypothetical protein